LDQLDGSREEIHPRIAGRFTAAQVQTRTPDRYAMTIELLAAGHGIIHIARLMQMSAHTVRAIREANPEPIAQQREKLIRRLGVAGALDLESICEDLEDPEKRGKIPTAQKGIIFGILNDHAQKMTGQPTSITATLEAKSGHDEAAAYLARMKTAENQQSPPATSAEMVCGAQTLPPKRDPGQMDVIPDEDRVQVYSDDAIEDVQSSGNGENAGDSNDQ
jgi:hypothetical protein